MCFDLFKCLCRTEYSSEVKELPSEEIFIYRKLDLRECPICLDHLINTETIWLPCGHLFHWNCIKQWIAKEYEDKKECQCPTCRSDISVLRSLFVD